MGNHGQAKLCDQFFITWYLKTAQERFSERNERFKNDP